MRLGCHIPFVRVADLAKLAKRELITAEIVMNFSRNISQRADRPLPDYDIVIMSDLLDFDTSHDVLVLALKTLLAKSLQARVYVAAGKYTAPHVCDNFLNLALNAGLIWEEDTSCTSGDPQNHTWMGTMAVAGLDIAQLSTRKSMCRRWIGRWSPATLT
jgi:nicotinamide N-methyltransferase